VPTAPKLRLARPPSAPKPRPAAALKPRVARQARRLGATLVGFAPVERWDDAGEVPAPYRPRAVWPQARTAIVVGVPMLLPVIETTPSIHYQELYDTSNRLLDDLGYRLAVWLGEKGHPSLFLPRDGYGSLEILLENPFAAFSHVMAAKYAGLGTIGLSHNLLVPEYGPRVRLQTVLTSAELPGDALLEDDLCNGCDVCVKLCPADALRARPGEVIGDLDKDACTRHHIALKKDSCWPCGVCVKVCPVGADRTAYGARSVKPYLDEKEALSRDPHDPRFQRLVHLRRHGSGGGRIA
jgi:epoxyqueuosine reductase